MTMTRSNDVLTKIKALNYKGSAEELYDAVDKLFQKCIKDDGLRAEVMERLTTEDLEQLIQFELC